MARSRSRSPRRRLSPERRERKRSRSPDRDRDRNARDKERSREEADRAAKRAKAEAEYERRKRMDVVKHLTGGEVDEEENEEGAYVDEAGDEDLDEEERAMKRMMGFATFDSTKGKPVEDNQKGAAKGTVKKGSTRTYRQYMNRKGGFNRPLDKIK